MSSPIASCIEQQARLDIVEEEDLAFVIFRKSVVFDFSSFYLILAATSQRFDARDVGSIRIGIQGLYLETSPMTNRSTTKRAMNVVNLFCAASLCSCCSFFLISFQFRKFFV